MPKGKVKLKKSGNEVQAAASTDAKGNSSAEAKKRQKGKNSPQINQSVLQPSTEISTIVGPPGISPTKSVVGEHIPSELEQNLLSSSGVGGGDINNNPKLKNPNAKSLKYIGLEPEWSSDEIRNTPLITDGYTCCVILLMEESALLSNYTTYLHQAVCTGIRRNFASIDGRTIAQKVRKYMTSMSLREAGQEDLSYMDRNDIWAEAIKHTLLHYKANALAELELRAKDQEITGIRSKELIKFIPPLAFATPRTSDAAVSPPDDSTSDNKVEENSKLQIPPKPLIQDKNDNETIQKQPKKSLVDKTPKKKGKGRRDSSVNKVQGGSGTNAVVDNRQHLIEDAVAAAHSKAVTKPTLLRKRGELPMQVLDFIEDSPPNGPNSYFFLQGMYNPELIEQLQLAGVNIDCVLLITAGTVHKRNFSSFDIEQNIAGTFRPHNILPDYVKQVEKSYTESPADQDKVSQFWTRLAEIINKADGHSSVHDIALMNCSLPSMDKTPETIEQKGLFAAKLFDEAAHRIYEMLVLTEWYNEYKSATTKKELQPIEPKLSCTLYDRLLNEIPAECITVPIIMECLIEQVVENDRQYNENSVDVMIIDEKDSKVDWDVPGCRIPGTNTFVNSNAKNTITQLKQSEEKPFLPIPSYIKSYDFASMRSCHLNRHFATNVASSQVCGDFHSIQQILWNENMPEYNKGLCMKLLGNLNHFMHFLPPGSIKFEDMFYILHLLLAAGVELELSKQSALSEKKNSTSIDKSNSVMNDDDVQDETENDEESEHHTEHEKLKPVETVQELNLITQTAHHERSQYRHHDRPSFLARQKQGGGGVEPSSENQHHGKCYPGTHLQLDHNYLVLQEPKSNTKFILAPKSNANLNLTQLANHGVQNPILHEDVRRVSKIDDVESIYGEDGEYHSYGSEVDGESHTGENRALRMDEYAKGPEDVIKAAVIATENLAETGVEFKYYDHTSGAVNVNTDPNPDKLNTKYPFPTPPNTAMEGDANGFLNPEDENIIENDPNSFASYFNNGRDVNGKRFIACEEEWFESITDSSVLEKLLECPALLSINENGALNLDSWVTTYLKSSNNSTGTKSNSNTMITSGLNRNVLGETGPIIGPLENWNYVEQLTPVQMIQALSEALNNYLCLDRMYCPFYDTILFIFTNPTPSSLKTDTEFYSKLHTLPGLQHFLEYSINEDHVLDWLLNLEKNKSVEIVDTFSVTTLMRLVPPDQWMLIPSIKWAILRARKEQDKIKKQAEKKRWQKQNETEEEDEEDEEFGQLKKDKDKVISEGKSTRKSVIKDGRRLSKNSSSGSARSSRIRKTSGDVKNKGMANGNSKLLRSERGETATTSDRETTRGEVSSSGGAGDRESGESRGTTLSSAEENWKEYLGVVDNDDPFKNLFGPELINELKKTVSSTASFNFTDALKESMGLRVADENSKIAGTNLLHQPPKFHCYDLGKRILVAASDTYHLFPMDGTLITYEISSIDPDFHMMQLCVKKNNYSSYFYPYYIPHDMDLSQESYVVCPYFHMIHCNGTIFSFQDLRAMSGDNPYHHFFEGHQHTQLHPEIFSYEKNVIFSDKLFDFLPSTSTMAQDEVEEESGKSTETPSMLEFSAEQSQEGTIVLDEGQEEEEEEVNTNHVVSPGIEAKSVKTTKKGKGKKEKGNKESKDKEKQEKGETGKDKKKGKKKPKSKGGTPPEDQKPVEKPDQKEEEEEEEGETMVEKSTEQLKEPSNQPESSIPKMDGEEEEYEGENEHGDWRYASSENTEAEGEGEDYNGPHQKGLSPSSSDNNDSTQNQNNAEKLRLLSPTNDDANWKGAIKLLEPMTHSFHITFPSGLFLSVDDVVGPPLRRTVKQTYIAKGSASSIIEKSRYCTMNGTVVKFLLNKTIQILTARGVTTIIQELKAHAETSQGHETAHETFAESGYVKVNKGTIILPTGERWRIKKGRKYQRDPLFVFSSGVLPNGETFRRRQDGVVYLHRHDGTVITHYPDGTRFTTRMVINKDPVEEFEDWVFVGLKYMIEHPNYSAVLTNTLSGNIHIRMNQSEWARIFSDGSIKIRTKDDYKLDVDKYRAVITNPSCAPGDTTIPNLVTVKLWHAHELLVLNKPEENQTGVFDIMNPKPEAELKKDDQTLKGEIHSELQQKTEMTQAESQPPKELEKEPSPLPPVTKAKKTHKPKPRKTITEKEKLSTSRPKGLRKKGRNAKAPRSSAVKKSQSLKSIPIGDNFDDEEEEEEEAEGEEYEGEGDLATNANEILKIKIKSQKFEIDEFLQFTDMWTFCKAIDCWDNRFTIDIFGDTIVDKCEEGFEKHLNNTMEQVINTISSKFELPKQYVSGILHSTSSEELSTVVKRQAALANMKQTASCSKLPNTRMFVVNRDLSGFEYLTKDSVDKMIHKAKSTLGSIVLKDTIPRPNKKLNNSNNANIHKQQPARQLIRIMEPVQVMEAPNGLWKSEYREPVFRPRFLANKQLKIARPEDLRWFSYILTTANARRPQFYLTPKENYLKAKKDLEKVVDEGKRNSIDANNEGEDEDEEEEEEEEAEEEPEIASQEKIAKIEKTESKSSKQTAESSNTKPNNVVEKGKKGKKDFDARTTVSRMRKKSSKNISKESANKESVKKTGAASEYPTKRSRKGKKVKGSKLDISGKSLKKRYKNYDGETEGEEDDDAFTVGPLKKMNKSKLPVSPTPIPAEKNLENVEIKKYPAKILDIKNLYGLNKEEELEVRAQFHPDIEPTTKAIVIRNIMEIPKIDQKMERALLAASLSYAKTIENQKRIYQSYEIQDTRTTEEKEQQKIIKQHLLEQNLEQMHLFEQKEGKLLQFHL